jgi:hypothetical protein
MVFLARICTNKQTNKQKKLAPELFLVLSTPVPHFLDNRLTDGSEVVSTADNI